MGYIQLINQIMDIRHKITQDNLMSKYERSFNRIISLFEEEGFIIKNPIGEKYRESSADCEANIVGAESADMVVTKVIKPIIYKKVTDKVSLVQKGIIVVENRKK